MINVAIVDSGLGNLYSVQQACIAVDLKTAFENDPNQLRKYDAIILPGVGAFQQGMENLKKLNLDESIKECHKIGIPLFGICLGMQLFFDKSEEFKTSQGLGLIAGNVLSLTHLKQTERIPNVGWNSLIMNPNLKNHPLSDTKSSDLFYFVHSFYCNPEDQSEIATLSSYGNSQYCSTILKNSLFGVQFHPEKSGPIGLEVYKHWRSFFLR